MHHVNSPPDWEGPTGFYHKDLRGLPPADESKRWDSLYFWAYPTYVPETMLFSLQAAQSRSCRGERAYRAAPPANRQYILELVGVPDGMVGAPPVGTTWTLPLGPLFTLEVPTYRTTDGLDGYRFAFTMTEALCVLGDFDCDGFVGLYDSESFAACFTGQDGSPVGLDCELGDFDGDGDVDCFDWDQFTNAWTDPGNPPPFAACDVAHPRLILGPEEFIKASGSDIVVPGYSVPSFVYWNGDDAKDLVIGEGGGGVPDGRVRVYLNVGTSSAPQFAGFSYAQSYGGDLTCQAEGCLGCFPRVLYWDGDARKDLLVGQADGTVKVYLNVGTDDDPAFDGGTLLKVGLPGSKIAIDVGTRATATASDWNDDDRKDLVVGGLDGMIHVYINEG